MEFLSKPMSEFWKSTKQTFSEIMDFNDTAIGGRKQRPSPANSQGSGPGVRTGDPNESDGPSPNMSNTGKTDMTDDIGSVSQETGKACIEKSSHYYRKHSTSKTKRPASENIPMDIKAKEHNFSSETVNSTGHQQKPPHVRHSLNNPFQKFNFGNFGKSNMTINSSKLDTVSKKSHYSKVKSGPIVSKEPKTLNLTSGSEQCESEKSLRSHRTHSHSRSRQGSSESQHFRSNSTDRGINNKETKEKERPFLRSASDDTMLSEQGARGDEDEDADDLSAEKMKTKILSMWNNVRYGWTVKTRTAFSLAKPIWILGKVFQHRPDDIDEQLPGLDTAKSPAMELFKREFSSRIWLTYRREFPQLAGSSYTTDCGWGCMLRSGQMLLAQSLVQHFLGRDWNYYNEQTIEERRYHHEIVRWFGDQPDDMSPFSLHRLVDIGKDSGKKAGDWYGPASVAHIFKEAMDKAVDLNPLLEQVCVYVAQDCTIYKQDVIDLCKRRRPQSLQPVYSDQGSTSSQISSPVTPTPSSAHSFHHWPPGPSSQVANTTSSSVVSESALSPTTVNGTTEKTLSSSRQSTIQQSSHTSSASNGELNGNLTTLDPPPEYPANSSPSAPDTSTHSNTDQSKNSQIENHSTKSKPEQLSHWEDNSHKGKAQAVISQRVDKPGLNEHPDVHHQSDGIRETRAVSASRSQETEGQGAGSSWCAVVILVPVRLGGDEVNPIYISTVQALFTLDCCIGIIGGKPKHSLYYVGFQDEKLIHLDPHYCQPVVDMKSREFPLSSFHCMSPRKMAISKMDPSCTVGFYLRTEKDFHDFCETVPQIVQCPGGVAGSTDYPMFILREGSCQDWNCKHSVNPDKPERYLRVRHIDQNGQLIAPMRETEDFVFLDS